MCFALNCLLSPDLNLNAERHCRHLWRVIPLCLVEIWSLRLVVSPNLNPHTPPVSFNWPLSRLSCIFKSCKSSFATIFANVQLCLAVIAAPIKRHVLSQVSEKCWQCQYLNIIYKKHYITATQWVFDRVISIIKLNDPVHWNTDHIIMWKTQPLKNVENTVRRRQILTSTRGVS